MARAGSWAWLDEIVAQPQMLTAPEIADALSRVETHLGMRPAHVVGPSFQASWLVGDEVLTAAVRHIGVQQGTARGRFAFEVGDLAALRLRSRYGDPGEADAPPYLWRLRLGEAGALGPVPEISTWAGFVEGLGEVWSRLPVQLQMLPAAWFSGTVTCADSWDSVRLVFSRDGLEAPLVTAVGPQITDRLTLWYGPEAALQAGRLLARHVASNFGGDFPLTDLDLEWACDRGQWQAVGLADEGSESTPERPTSEASELIRLATRASGFRTLETPPFPRAELDIVAGTAVDLSTLPLPVADQQEPGATPPATPDSAATRPHETTDQESAAPAGAAADQRARVGDRPSGDRKWWKFWG